MYGSEPPGNNTLQFGYFSGKVARMISHLEISDKTRKTAVFPIGTLIEEDRYFNRRINVQEPYRPGVFSEICILILDHRDLLNDYIQRYGRPGKFELNFFGPMKSLHVARIGRTG